MQSGVEQTAEKWAFDLLDDLRTGFLRVVLRDDRTKPVVVEVVLLCELVGGALDEVQF